MKADHIFSGPVHSHVYNATEWALAGVSIISFVPCFLPRSSSGMCMPLLDQDWGIPPGPLTPSPHTRTTFLCLFKVSKHTMLNSLASAFKPKSSFQNVHSKIHLVLAYIPEGRGFNSGNTDGRGFSPPQYCESPSYLLTSCYSVLCYPILAKTQRDMISRPLGIKQSTMERSHSHISFGVHVTTY